MAALQAKRNIVLNAFLCPSHFFASSAGIRRAAPTRKAFMNAWRRPFSQTSSKSDKQSQAQLRARKQHYANADRNISGQPSITRAGKAQMRSQVAGGQQDFDIGLFPNTLVMPSLLSSKLPSPLSAGRWRVEWHRIKQRAQDIFSLLYFKFYSGMKPRPRLDLADIPDIARRLHYDMWTAFAAGDDAALKRICAQGVMQDLTTRISRRSKGEIMRWNLHQYNDRPTVVSHRAAQIPDSAIAIRQAVVRIKSRQSLERTSGKNIGKEDAGAANEAAKDVDEYLVIQRALVNKQLGDWYVWGTTRETDLGPIIAGAI